MTTPREAAEQALAALEKGVCVDPEDSHRAIYALRAALAEPAAPPLPEAANTNRKYGRAGFHGPHGPAYTADQMREYAAACVAAAVPQWQPIETAPKDGTTVLCFRFVCGKPQVTSAWWRPDAGAFGGDGWSYSPIINAPTHWMPLPAAPEVPR